MAAERTEYQEEYCGGSGKKSKSGGQPPIIECSKSYDVQPVGGRVQAMARAAQEVKLNNRTEAKPWQASGLPAFDEDYVATVYSEAEQGTHRIRPSWTDPRWSDPVRAANSTLYQTADRDPASRNQHYVYRTTLIDALNTPVTPLPVPDVHKLRYMTNNYMTPDDWY